MPKTQHTIDLVNRLKCFKIYFQFCKEKNEKKKEEMKQESSNYYKFHYQYILNLTK